MNFLFATGAGLVSASIILAIYLVIPRYVWDMVPEPYQKYRNKVAGSLALLVLISVTYSNLVTYGPRVTLDKARMPTSPDRVPVEETSEFIEHVDRLGKFDQRIEKEPVQ